MRAQPGFYARNHIDKALLLYSPLFHLVFLSLVLMSGGLLPTRR